MAPPLNIAIHIHGLHGGGAERAVSLLAGDLVQQGHRVLVITCEPASTHDYPLHSAVQRLAIGDATGGYRATRVCRRFWRLRRAIANFDTDVVLGFMTTSALYALSASLGLRAKAVCCERVAPHQQVLSKFSRMLRRRLFPFADAVVCQTSAAARWYRTQFAGGRIETIPNAVRLPLADLKPELVPATLVAEAAPLLLAVGRLDPQKGFDLLIEAFAAVADQLPAVHLVVLGEGPQRAALEALIQAHGLEQRVLLPGRAGNMTQWYRRATAFVLSSRFEGFPNVLLEAMAHAVPVLATDCDYGPAELISHEQTGLLVAAEDVNALKLGLIRLIEDPALRASLASQGRSTADRYEPATVIAEWQTLLTELTAGRNVTA